MRARDRIQLVVARVRRLEAVRTWDHHAARRGPILASGLAFQALFAVFAAVWGAFSIAGIVVSGNSGLRSAVLDLLDAAVPGLVDRGSGGAIDPGVLASTPAFGIATGVAFFGLLVTALGWLASAREAIRGVLELDTPPTNALLLRLRDLGLGAALGVLLVVAAAAGTAGASLLDDTLAAAGVGPRAAGLVARVLALPLVALAYAGGLAALYRLVSDVRVGGRELATGSLLGGVGLALLTLLGGFLLGGARANPLIASFGVVAGLLLYYQFACQVILLVAARWAVRREGTVPVGVRAAG